MRPRFLWPRDCDTSVHTLSSSSRSCATEGVSACTRTRLRCPVHCRHVATCAFAGPNRKRRRCTRPALGSRPDRACCEISSDPRCLVGYVERPRCRASARSPHTTKAVPRTCRFSTLLMLAAPPAAWLKSITSMDLRYRRWAGTVLALALRGGCAASLHRRLQGLFGTRSESTHVLHRQTVCNVHAHSSRHLAARAEARSA